MMATKIGGQTGPRVRCTAHNAFSMRIKSSAYLCPTRVSVPRSMDHLPTKPNGAAMDHGGKRPDAKGEGSVADGVRRDRKDEFGAIFDVKALQSAVPLPPVVPVKGRVNVYDHRHSTGFKSPVAVLTDEPTTNEVGASYERLYQGGLSVGEKTIVVRVRMDDITLKSGWFPFSNYEKREEAFVDAEAFRRKLCLMRDGQVDLHIFETLSPERGAYCAGMMDGDGHIRWADGLRLGVCQSSINDLPPPLLAMFQRHFGGDVYKDQDSDPKHKPRYHWVLCGSLAFRLLRMLEPWMVLKSAQARFVLDAFKSKSHQSRGMKIPTAITAPLKAQFLKMHSKEWYTHAPLDPTRINTSWFAGFFDAEGSVVVENDGQSAGLTAYQDSCPRLIAAIKEKLGGHVTAGSNSQIRFHGATVFELMRTLLPLLIVKCSQIEAILAHFTNRPRYHSSRRRTQTQIDADLALVEHIKSLRRYHSSDTTVAIAPPAKRKRSA